MKSLFLILAMSLLAPLGHAQDRDGGNFNGGGGGDSLRLEKAGQFTWAAQELLRYLHTQDLSAYPQLDLKLLETKFNEPGVQIYSTDGQLYAQENGQNMPVEAVTSVPDKRIVYMSSLLSGQNAIRSRLTILHELIRLAGYPEDGGSLARQFLPIIIKDYVRGTAIQNIDGTITYVGDANDPKVPLQIKLGGRWASIPYSMLEVYQIVPGALDLRDAFSNVEEFCNLIGQSYVSMNNSGDKGPATNGYHADLHFPPHLVPNPGPTDRTFKTFSYVSDITCRYPQAERFAIKGLNLAERSTSSTWKGKLTFVFSKTLTVSLKDNSSVSLECNGDQAPIYLRVFHITADGKRTEFEYSGLLTGSDFTQSQECNAILDKLYVNGQAAHTLRFSNYSGIAFE